MLLSFLLLIFIVLATAETQNNIKIVPVDQDVGKDQPTMIKDGGYNVETHFATTLDGYILTLFRIPSRRGNTEKNKKPVIIQHGLLDSSYAWTCNSADESLGFILADVGYDVWFGNNRGNRYGRNHTSLDPDDGTPDFWEFTWDEMALYDVPAIISYVLENTQASSTAWIGHSEGTTQFFAAAATAGDAIDRDQDSSEALQNLVSAIRSVNLFIALAPVAYVNNCGSKLLSSLAATDIVQQLLNKKHFGQLFTYYCRLSFF